MKVILLGVLHKLVLRLIPYPCFIHLHLMTQLKNLTIIALLIALFGCTEKKNNIIGGDTFYAFENQPSSFTFLKNQYRVDVGEQTGESKFNGTYVIYDATQDPVPFSDLILHMETSGFSMEMTLEPDFSLEDYIGEADSEMEKQLDTYYNKLKLGSLKSSTLPAANLVTIQYRTEELTAFKISSDQTLFGIQAGESLNDYIELFNGSLLFDYSKQLIGPIDAGTSVSKWMSYRPLIGAEMQFRFKESPDELPLSARFIIEMELDNQQVLRDTSDIVELVF